MKRNQLLLALAASGIATSAFATNGYFSHGYGMKEKGMAGVATTSTDDAFGGANNPATMVFAGDRFDIGVDLFSPRREASRSDSEGFGGEEDPGRDFSTKSDSNYFLVPELGYNRMINSDVSLGVTVYGNGGMNTNYKGDVTPDWGCNPSETGNALCGAGRLGVNLMQLIIAPTVAFKLASDHSVGISPLIGYQRFEAKGLQGFTDSSSSPSNLTNNGNDDAWGYGARVGYFGRLSPTVSVGAAYATKMNFSEFDKYKGLFAEQGDFDIPENWNAGIAWQATPAVKLALDYQRINYSKVKAVGNPMSNMFPPLEAALGADNGPGFGWDDVKVWKLGVEYKSSPQLTLRAGYSIANNPIKGDMTCATPTNCGEVAFNILAPAVIRQHASLGFTYALSPRSELTMAYTHAFANDVSGVDPVMGGVDKIKMHQDSVGVAYGMKF